MQAEDHDGVAICNRTGPETKEHFLLRGHCNLNTCIWSGAVLKASRPCAMHMGDKADTQWPDGAGWRWVATLGADTCMHVSKKEERWRLLFCFCGVFICIDLRLEKATRRFFLVHLRTDGCGHGGRRRGQLPTPHLHHFFIPTCGKEVSKEQFMYVFNRGREGKNGKGYVFFCPVKTL